MNGCVHIGCACMDTGRKDTHIYKRRTHVDDNRGVCLFNQFFRGRNIHGIYLIGCYGIFITLFAALALNTVDNFFTFGQRS